jgi:DNA polymerase
MPFGADQKYAILDFETRSKCKLNAAGAWEYSLDKSTQILCAAFRLGTRAELSSAKTWVWSPALGPIHKELIDALCDPSVIIVAHNAFFEQVITRNVLSKLNHRPELKDIPPDRWICTATLAASLALPRALENACKALGLTAEKDMVGHRLMLKMSKPRKPTKDNPATWHQSKADLIRLMEYCAKDVDAETELFLKCPPLSDFERKTWLLDQKINLRGFHVDRDLIKTALRLTELEVAGFNQTVKEITNGAVDSVNKRDALLKWLKVNDCFMPDLRANTVREYLKEGLATGDAKKLLEARQAGAKSSTKKYKAFEIRSRNDGIVRDHLLYGGTIPTMRFSGRGAQVHNLPRPAIRDTDLAAEVVKTGDLDLIRNIYGNPLDTFSSCLRSVIVPPPGRKFFCGDYSSIEVCVGFWFADHAKGLVLLRQGKSLYYPMASAIYGVPAEDIKKGTPEYQLGKGTILACQYGEGPDKFRDTARLVYRVEISDDLAKKSVGMYRRIHYPIPQTWTKLEQAATFALKNPGRVAKVCKTRWSFSSGFLWCELPSGRKLAYPEPALVYEKTSWGDKRARLSFMTWNPKAKGQKWIRQHIWGGVFFNHVVQGTARDLMVYAMHASEAKDYLIDITVHDELLTNAPDDGKACTSEFEKLMAGLPSWAEGLPINVEAWTGARYRK